MSEVSAVRSNLNSNSRSPEPEGMGPSQPPAWGLQSELYAEEMEQREAAAWVEFVIVGQRRKPAVCNE